MKKTSLLFIALFACIGLIGCMRPQAVVTAATLTDNQLALMKVDAMNQMDILTLQRTTLSQESDALKANAKVATAAKSVSERDWRAAGNKEKLEILAGVRQDDTALRADPYIAVRPDVTVLSDPPGVDLKGLDQALSGISRLTGSRPFDVEDIKPFVTEIAKAYEDLQKKREEFEKQRAKSATSKANKKAKQ